jgi:hypothetical protein
MLDLKNCNWTTTFSASPYIKFHNPLSGSTGDTGGQTGRYGKARSRTYINFHCKRTKPNLSERVNYTSNGRCFTVSNSAASHNKFCKETNRAECMNVDTQYTPGTQNFSEYALSSAEERPWLMGWVPPLRIQSVWIQGQTTCISLKYEPVSLYGCLSCLHCHWQWLFKDHY